VGRRKEVNMGVPTNIVRGKKVSQSLGKYHEVMIHVTDKAVWIHGTAEGMPRTFIANIISPNPVLVRINSEDPVTVTDLEAMMDGCNLISPEAGAALFRGLKPPEDGTD